MPDITSDDIHEHLIRKISNQAAQLGLLNNDLCDAAEYIKTCESKLIEFENAAFASSKQIEIYERTNRSNEDVISKLQQNLTSKEGQLAIHRKEIADLSKEIQKLRVQLKTAQHSLRFASQTPSSTDNGSQSKSRSEVILLKANLKLYKEQAESAKSSEQSMKSKVLTLEKILEDHSIYSGNSSRGERLNDQHDMISSTALASGRGAILSNPAGVQLNNRSDRGTASSESAVRDSGIIERRSMTAVEQLIKSSQIEAFEAQRELSTMQLNELSRQLKAVEEERDTLLQYIQVQLRCKSINFQLFRA